MSTNDYERRNRAWKVEKLVSSATFCNDQATRDVTDWPQDHGEGLRKLASLLAVGEMWTAVEVFANVASSASEETRGMVVMALLAKAEETDEATDDAIGRELLASM